MARWISCEKRLPEIGVPVWCSDDQNIWIGQRDDAEEGWLWGRVYDAPYRDAHGWWVLECEQDDDYQPTQWMALPELPKG